MGSLKILIILLTTLSSILGSTSGECNLTSDISQEFVVNDSAPIGQAAFTLLASQKLDGVWVAESSKYFNFSYQPGTTSMAFYPTLELHNFFKENPISDQHISILNLRVSCYGGAYFVIPEIKIFVQDGNSETPQVDPISATYNIDLPYSGLPINWQNYIKITDEDFLEENTAVTLYTDRPDLIDLTQTALLERVPEDPTVRLEYYKMYFGLNHTWNQVGTHWTHIQVKDGGGLSSLFEVTLVIDKKCKLLTETRYFEIYEDAVVGEPVIRLDVEYVNDIDTSFDPMNDKYFDFELDQINQHIYVKPKDTLASFFEDEDNNTNQFSILGLNLICPGTFHVEPEIQILVIDRNNKSPKFYPDQGTFYPELPFIGTDPINGGDQFLKVMDADFENVNTHLTFKIDQNDLIYLTPAQPERVPMDTSLRLEYYKVYFTLRNTWTTPGVQVAIIMAKDDAGNEGNFTVTLDMTRCVFLTNLSRPFVIPENSKVGEAALILDVEGVTSIDTSADPVNDKYFLYELNATSQQIYVKPKSNLVNFFDTETSPSWSINEISLNCSRAFLIEPIVSLLIQDVNDRVPSFDPVGGERYEVSLPFFGGPVNWRQFIKVMDTDFLPNNTALSFSIDRSDLIIFLPEVPERVPANEDERLEYYILYFGMNESWTGVGIEVANLRATDDAGNFAEFQVTLELTRA